jgi:hypothetical protein
MGHPADVFITPPPDSCNCAVCLDILQNAVSFKECGHSFCNECATACLNANGLKSCPTCPAQVTGIVPNFTTREMIGSMMVNCLHGNDGSKRAKGNDKRTRSKSTGCGWTGKCDDLKEHDDVCEFKIVGCELYGCNYECRRKDMKNHQSGEDGVLHHMMLMSTNMVEMKKQEKSLVKRVSTVNSKVTSMDLQLQHFQAHLTRYNEKLTASDRKYTTLHEKIKSLEEKISELEEASSDAAKKMTVADQNMDSVEKKIKDLESAMEEMKQANVEHSVDELVVNGCGLFVINGTYRRCPTRDGEPMYSKTGWNWGTQDTIAIFRGMGAGNDKMWYISSNTSGSTYEKALSFLYYYICCLTRTFVNSKLLLF